MMRIDRSVVPLNNLLSEVESNRRAAPESFVPPAHRDPLSDLSKEERDLVIAYRAVKAANADEQHEKPKTTPPAAENNESTLNAAKLSVLKAANDSSPNTPNREYMDADENEAIPFGLVAFMAVEEMAYQEFLPRPHVDLRA